MKEVVLERFLFRIRNDPGIDAKHISLFIALYTFWLEKGIASKIKIYSHEIMPMAKISSSATYFKKLSYLSEKKYINYQPTRCYRKGSVVSMNI